MHAVFKTEQAALICIQLIQTVNYERARDGGLSFIVALILGELPF